MHMSKEDTLKRIKEVGLLAVIRGPSPDLTLEMVDALVEGGVTGIEITYSTPNAPDVVRAVSEKYGDRIVLGMGTLTKPEQAQEAGDAGATFLAPIYHELTAIICTSGTVRSHIGIVSREFQVPCVMACEFVGDEPEAGAEVELDCSGEDAVVRG